jgi:branched-chain amino acid transport system permease protein
MPLFLEQLLNGLATGSIYALVTLGLALVYGIMRILHVAHAAVYTIGAYVGLLFFDLTGSLFLAVLGSMAVCALVGVAIERFVYFPAEISALVPLIATSRSCFRRGAVAGRRAQILTFNATLPFRSFKWPASR